MSTRDAPMKATPVGFDEKQQQAMNKIVQTKKSAKVEAREEEKNYVEYRKRAVLYEFRPKTAGYRKNTDDSFPKKRSGVSMGFGEKKAELLAIRPNPKYATWFGKRTKKEDKKHKATVVKAEKVAPATPAAMASKRSVRVQPGDGPEDEEDKVVQRRGRNWANPIAEGGVPFWMAVEQEEEVDDEDYIVNIESLEKVNKGELRVVSVPMNKKSFDPYGDVKLIMKEDSKIFDKKITFSNTVTSVLSLMGEGGKGVLPPAFDRKVSWSKQMTTIAYGLDVDRKDWTHVEEPLKDIIKPKE